MAIDSATRPKTSNPVLRAIVWIVAIALWLYAGAAFFLGVALLLAPMVGLPLVAGAALVATGTYVNRRGRANIAGAMLVAGGVLVGGSVGVLGEAIASVEGESLVAAFVIGSIAFGSPAILAGLGLWIGTAFHDLRNDSRRRESP